MGSRYTYSALSRDREEIRLLKIATSQGPHNPTCHLVHRPLADAPSYNALSYQWNTTIISDGSTVGNCNSNGGEFFVNVNGKALRVFENLYRAMVLLASNDHSFLWIDAICIDQGNVAEREHQVGLMGRIFCGAEQVLAWLGPHSPCSPSTIDFLRALAQCQDNSDYRERVISTTEGPDALARWTGMFNFVRREWWQRVWIIQEYVLGRDVIFLCGDAWFDSLTFSRAFAALRDCWGALFATSTLTEIGFNARIMDPIWNLILLRNRLRQSTAPPIQPLMHLSLTRSSQSTDPRDRLFAQYGLIGKQTSSFCPPIYTLPETNVFAIFFDNYVKGTGDLSILCHAGMDNWTEKALPTWLARWNPERHVYPLLCDWSGHERTYPAFNVCPWATTPDFDLSSDMVLRCKGVIIDEVDGVQYDSWCKMPWEDSHGVQSVSTKNMYGGSASTFEALWRTMVADTNRKLFTTGLVPCVPERAPRNFGFLFATKCQEINNLLDLEKELQGVMPTMSRPGCTNIERRWHGMRELKLGGLRLGDTVSEMANSSLSSEDLREGALVLSCDWENFEGSHGQVFYRRRLYTTISGRLGVSTRSLKPRDKICIILGCPVPLLLRQNNDYWQLVGETYIHGIMQGESISQKELLSESTNFYIR